MNQKNISIFFLIVLALSMLTGCSSTGTTTTVEATTVSSDEQTSTSFVTEEAIVDSTKDDAYAETLTLNNSVWNYDAENDRCSIQCHARDSRL